MLTAEKPSSKFRRICTYLSANLYYIFLWLLCSLFLFISFEISVFHNLGVGYEDFPVIMGHDSYLVLNRLALTESSTNFWSPLVWFPLEKPPQSFYLSQFGLQGIVLSAINNLVFKLDPLVFALFSAHVFCCLTAATLAIFCVSVYSIFTLLPALVTTFAIGFSPWIANFSVSLYWAAFLLFAPFIASWIFYPLVLKKKVSPLFLYGLLFTLICAKSLCGYEYITSLILSAAVPIFFFHLREGRISRHCLLSASTVVAAGIGGFLLAIAVHILQINHLVGLNGLEIIARRMKDRTTFQISADHQIFIDSSLKGMQANAWISYVVNQGWISPRVVIGVQSFFRYFSFDAFRLPILAWPIKTISIGTCTIFSLFSLIFLALPIKNKLHPDIKALIVSTNFGLLSSLSWQVMAFNHMSLHFYLNSIVFYMPFLLTLYVFVGVLADALWRIVSAHCNRKFLTYFLATLFVLLIAKSAVQALSEQQRLNVVIQSIGDPTYKTSEEQLTGYVEKVNVNEVSSLVSGDISRSILSPKTSNLEIRGWALDLQKTSNPVEIVVAVNGVVVAHQPTNYPRPDVESSLKVSAPQPGFTMQLPLSTEVSQFKAENIQVYAVTLTDTPKVKELSVIHSTKN